MGILDLKDIKDTYTPVSTSGLDIGQKEAISGVGGSSKPEQTCQLAKAPDEILKTGPASTYISLGRDRPAELGTGYEGSAEPNAGCIWICSGMSQGLVDKTPKNKDGTSLEANRNVNLDASTVYISSCADIDRYFNLVKGGMGNSESSAAIALKSSDLRFIARNGIKLITGTDVTNEYLREKASIVGIEIIAGNDDSDLQPMVKGHNLALALEDLLALMGKVVATVQVFMKHQNDFNSVLKEHTHPDVINMILSIIATNGLNNITGGNTLPDQEVFSEGMKTEGFLTKLLSECDIHRENFVTFRNKYLAGTEEADINSRYNKVN